MSMKISKDFKIRCSAISQIMTMPRSKSELLSETAKTYVEKWAKEYLYGRKIAFSSKYTQKGVACEIGVINSLGLKKNEQYFENEFLTGTPDSITYVSVIDIKNSWSIDTFPLFETEAQKQYIMQLNGYMELTSKRQGEIIYALSDMPEDLIISESYRIAKERGEIHTEDHIAEATVLFTYLDVSESLKIKRFAVNYDADFIASVYTQVDKCRVYLKSIL